jgi:uncharacterized membrane protein HdeD (DUF308 family)
MHLLWWLLITHFIHIVHYILYYIWKKKHLIQAILTLSVFFVKWGKLQTSSQIRQEADFGSKVTLSA